MMDKEFCLKDKIKRTDTYNDVISVRYAKEFIKIIEQKILTDWKGQNEFIDWLKKRTGNLE